MIRIRFFGSGELIQNGFRRARYECCAEKYWTFWILLEMNAEVCTAHASISEFASRCAVVLRDLDIMSTSTGKIRFMERRLHS